MFASQVMCKKEFAWFIFPGSPYGKAQNQFTQILLKLREKKSPDFQLIINLFMPSKKNLTSAFQYYLLQQAYRNKYGK